MLLKRFYDDGLAQASYLVGSERTGEALVVDPVRDLEPYLAAAADEELRITHVTETHIHADFLSGARDLVRVTGARLLLSAEGGADWQYHFGPDERAELLRDGDRFTVGEIQIDARHMPGHTPEHLVYLVTDTASADRPLGIFTGDFIFVGDVGRPDLLERAANVAGTMESSARALFRSLRAMREYPDYLQLWPGHGPGSACGKALGSLPSTTLGYERLFNWAFQAADEEEFVRAVLTGQPEPPKYFGRMKLLNRDGPPPASETRVPLIDDGSLAARLAEGTTTVVDTRASAAFTAGFLPGAINLPAGRSFTTWAGSLLSPESDIILIAEDERRTRALVRELSLIGVTRVIGWAEIGIVDRWQKSGRQLSRVRTIDANSVESLEDAVIVDVRAEAEWNEGHIPGARHIFLGDLMDVADELPRDQPLVIACQGGSRSSIGTSLLRARGFENVINFSGGFAEWRRTGLPIETDDATAPSR